MESQWRRSSAFLEPGLDEVNHILSQWHVTADSVEPLREGHANSNHRVVLSDGRSTVLRISQRDVSSLKLEHAIAEGFHSVIPIPRVLFADFESGTALREWLPGRTMQALLESGESDEVLAGATDLGRILARICSIRFPAAGFLAPSFEISEPWPLAIDGYFGYLDMCLGRPSMAPFGDLARRIRSRFAELDSRLRETAGPPCLTHGDYKASNILIEDGRVSGVLDWEFAHSGSWLLSTAQILRHPEDLPSGFQKRFAGGYRMAGGVFPEDWVELSRAVDLVNLCDFLSRDKADTVMEEDLLRLIEATLVSLPSDANVE